MDYVSAAHARLCQRQGEIHRINRPNSGLQSGVTYIKYRGLLDGTKGGPAQGTSILQPLEVRRVGGRQPQQMTGAVLPPNGGPQSAAVLSRTPLRLLQPFVVRLHLRLSDPRPAVDCHWRREKGTRREKGKDAPSAASGNGLGTSLKIDFNYIIFHITFHGFYFLFCLSSFSLRLAHNHFPPSLSLSLFK
jgi:hypothetical protein